MNTLATLTGADVAASTNRTGHVSQLGDWMLEANTGTIEAAMAVDAHTQATGKGHSPPTEARCWAGSGSCSHRTKCGTNS